MPILNHILPFELYRKLIEQNQGLNLKFAQNLNKKYLIAVCPFKVTLGTLATTESGYKPANAEPTDFTQFSKTWTSNESSIVKWIDSADLSQKPDKRKELNKTVSADPGLGVIKFKPGKSFWGVILREQTNLDNVTFNVNNLFSSQQLNERITIRFYNTIENEYLFNNIVKSNYWFYVIPQSFINQPQAQVTRPHEDQNRVFYYVEQNGIVRNPGKEIVYIDVTFVNFKNNLSSGQRTAFYLQMGGPGQPYAFPKYVNFNEQPLITLDEIRMLPTPVMYGQFLGFMNMVFHGIKFYGQPYYYNSGTLTEFVLDPPGQLFCIDWQGAIPDVLNLKKKPENEYYYLVDAHYELISSFDKIDKLKTLYDNYAQRKILGLLQSNKKLTQKTNNPGSSLKYSFWDDKFVFDADNYKTQITVIGNNNFAFNHDGHIDYPEGKALALSDFKYKDLAHYNLIVSAFYDILTELPMTSVENIKIGLNKIPIFGKLWGLLIGGIIPGFAKNKTYAPPFACTHGLISRTLYDNYVNNLFVGEVWSLQGHENINYLPLNVFLNGEKDGIGMISGTIGHTNGFAFGFTNKLKTRAFNLDSHKFTTTKYVIDSNYLQQVVKIGNESHTFLLNKQMHIEPVKTVSDFGRFIETEEKFIGYIIHMFLVRFTGEGNYQLKFFTKSKTRDYLSDDDCVFIGNYKSKSVINSILRDFNNYQKLSDPLLEFKKPFHFPADTSPIYPAVYTPTFVWDLSQKTFTFKFKVPIARKYRSFWFSPHRNVDFGFLINNVQYEYYDFLTRIELDTTPIIEILKNYDYQFWTLDNNINWTFKIIWPKEDLHKFIFEYEADDTRISPIFPFPKRNYRSVHHFQWENPSFLGNDFKYDYDNNNLISIAKHFLEFTLYQLDPPIVSNQFKNYYAVIGDEPYNYHTSDGCAPFQNKCYPGEIQTSCYGWITTQRRGSFLVFHNEEKKPDADLFQGGVDISFVNNKYLKLQSYFVWRQNLMITLQINTQNPQYIYQSMNCLLIGGPQYHNLPKLPKNAFKFYLEFTGTITGLKIHFKRKA